MAARHRSLSGSADRSSPPPLRRAWPPTRATCASIRDATIAAGGISGLDETLHFLEGAPDDVARYVLILDAINFGSGWFDELDTTTDALTRAAHRARARRRARGPPTELRALDAAAVGATPRPDRRAPADAPRTRPRSTTSALFLGDRPMLDVLGDSAEDARRAARGGMPFFDDRGFYKRAQIAANDLHLAGVVDLSRTSTA